MVAGSDSTVFINEFHYDNVGTDTGEFIEIANTAGTILDGWSLVLYNGTNGKPYSTIALTGSAALTVINLNSDGLQNAHPKPDGFALVNSAKQVVQFLSYEGAFTPKDGIAAGLTSTDIGVSEDGDTPIGHSLQLSGTGKTAGDFQWNSAAAATSGASNSKQAFAAESVTIIGDKSSNKLNGADNARDTIIGQRGADSIHGNGGNDFLLGNREDDTLYGDDGEDTLYGGGENDILYGGAGNDRLNGDKHDDQLFGGKGADTFMFSKAFGSDYIGDFEDGIDTIEFSKKVFKGFDEVKAAMGQDGADVIIKDAVGNMLRIENITLDQLTAADFLFV